MYYMYHANCIMLTERRIGVFITEMKKKQLYHATLCCFFVAAALEMEPSQQSINDGKQQYELLSQKAQIPNYGKFLDTSIPQLTFGHIARAGTGCVKGALFQPFVAHCLAKKEKFRN